MKNITKLFFAAAFLTVGVASAQSGVGIGTTNPDASSALDVTSTTKGFLMPRMTTAQRTAITAPAAGLQVYDTTTNSQWYYNGTAWVQGGTTAASSKFTNDATNTRVALTNLSDGITARPAGTEFAIKDNGAIGIGTATPNTDALLEMNTTNKGLLLPRVQLTSLTSPAPLATFTPGMVVYCIGNAGTAPNNVTAGFYIASSTSWTRTTMSLGDRGDITITGDMQTPTFTIDNGVVASEKLASSLKVGGGAPTNPSVALEVTGGNKGFVVSTTSSLASIANPIVGMMVYSTTENCLRIYTATGWSNCLLAATGDVSTGGSGVASAYGAGVNKSTTPVYGKRVSGLTTTSSATVGTAGSYNIIASSATLPGLIFTATGTFAGTGAQTVILTAVGAIDSAYAGATHTFTSNTTPSFTFTLTVAAMTYVTGAGSTFNAFYNGHVDNVYTGTTTTVIHTAGETFSYNANCTAKTISQTSPANCPASVTGTSGTVYPLVWINGQCWMQTNLKEVPTNFPDAPNTGNNIWTTSLNADGGKWGYYNTTTTDGSAGWGTTEPAAGEGILYQWSAAMNNATAERAQGACPTGFHIPSDCEWSFLENGISMAVTEQNVINAWRSTAADNQGTPGYKLRSQGTGQNNASGFSGLLAGYRSENTGTFSNRASSSICWSSSSTSATTAIYRSMYTGFRGVARTSNNKSISNSVRCLKD